MKDIPFYKIDQDEIETSATNIIARMIDGFGFRYRWATEDFTENEIHFCPIEGSMTMMELMKHIYGIIQYADKIFGGTSIHHKSLVTFDDIRMETLNVAFDLSTRLKSMQDSDLDNCSVSGRYELPFIYMVNGPIADVLTHVGQITSWRRIAGNPQPKGMNPFLGIKEY
jgi:hypothetical protein